MNALFPSCFFCFTVTATSEFYSLFLRCVLPVSLVVGLLKLGLGAGHVGLGLVDFGRADVGLAVAGLVEVGPRSCAFVVATSVPVALCIEHVVQVP